MVAVEEGVEEVEAVVVEEVVAEEVAAEAAEEVVEVEVPRPVLRSLSLPIVMRESLSQSPRMRN